MTARHTAGPWSVEVEADCHDNQADIYVCHPGTVCNVTVVCTMGQSARTDPAQKLADARLIASAPDMLAALQRIAYLRPVGDVEKVRGASDVVRGMEQIARAAIAKATGA